MNLNETVKVQASESSIKLVFAIAFYVVFMALRILQKEEKQV